jgi:hypothetical protein
MLLSLILMQSTSSPQLSSDAANLGVSLPDPKQPRGIRLTICAELRQKKERNKFIATTAHNDHIISYHIT